MRTMQLAQRLWDALQKGEMTPCVDANGLTVQLHACAHDAFSCAAKQLTVRWRPKGDWDDAVARCERALKVLHPQAGLVERDDADRFALFRSPLTRGVYWEGRLRLSERDATFTVQRWCPDEQGNRQPMQFLMTIEQMAELLAAFWE